MKHTPLHLHLDTNTKGRDLIIGDLHGCYDQLMFALKQINFDSSIDRLISVGDIIDRGPKSLECANLINEPWFYMVMGNHEQLMWKSIIEQLNDHINCWMQNGGIWFKDVDPTIISDLSNKFKQLPLIISVGEGKERYNVVHADLTNSDHNLVTNQMIDEWDFSDWDEHHMLWGRILWNNHNKDVIYQHETLSPTYVGHTSVFFKPIQIERQIYLDTGISNSVRKPNTNYSLDKFFLSIASPNEQIIYMYNPTWKRIVRHTYNSINLH